MTSGLVKTVPLTLKEWKALRDGVREIIAKEDIDTLVQMKMAKILMQLKPKDWQ